jgi:hypothetical protein
MNILAIFEDILKRNKKHIEQNFFDVLSNEVYAMQNLQRLAKDHFRWLKLGARSKKGWEKNTGVEEDYVGLCVTQDVAHMHLSIISSVRARADYHCTKPKCTRLYDSAQTYYKEIYLLVQKAKHMIEEHYEKEQEKGEKKK